MQKPILSLSRWSFSPGLISSLTTLLLLPFFVYLSFWQFSRMSEKQKLQQILENRMNRPVMTLSTLLSSPLPLQANSKKTGAQINSEIDKIRYRQLQITGIFLNEYSMFLDNQIADRQVGYHVITPFLPDDSETILLVDRGWISLGNNRAELPSLLPLVGKISLIGTINTPISGLQLKKASAIQNTNTWPTRISRIEFQELSTVLSRKLFPFVLQLNPHDPHGFKITPIKLNISATRHLGYAIQWLLLAIGIFIYYVMINCYSKSHKTT